MNNDAENVEANPMSMRDVFASRAMTGLVSGIAMAPNGTSELFDLAEQRGMAPHEVVAISAYRYADAMLKARVSTMSDQTHRAEIGPQPEARQARASNPRPRAFYPVDEVCSMGGFSRAMFYSLRAKGLLRVSKILGKVVVTAADWERFLEAVERGEVS